MDGRDIGTVVLPNADVKIFLTASPEERARRRYKELSEKSSDCPSYEEVLEDIKQRDYNDSHREISPLKKADNAVVVDTSDLSLEESIKKLASLIRERV
jgi:cytidylate kinase